MYSRTLTDKADIENCQLFESDSVEFLSQQLISLKSVLIQHCRTSQYMEYVELVRTFLLADRTSDWLLRLDTVSKCCHWSLLLDTTIMLRQLVFTYKKCVTCLVHTHGSMSSSLLATAL